MPVTLQNWKPRRNPLWPTSDVFYNDLALFALGSSGAYSINLVGSLPVCEILVLAMAPFLVLRYWERAFRREYLWFYVLLFGWFLGTIISDVYMDSPLPLRLKGIARVIFWGLDFIVLATLINRKARGMIAWALGFIVVQVASARPFPDFSTRWKFGYGYAVAMILLLISSRFYAQRRYWISVFISLGVAFLNLRYASRSQMLIVLVSGALIMPIFAGKQGGAAGQPAYSGKNLARLIVLLVIIGGAVYAANEAIKFATAQGFYSEGDELKFQQQQRGRLGMIVGGRPETLVAIQAIRDSPIIGHGSFAQDVRYLVMMEDIQYEYGYADTDVYSDPESGDIPTHSHLTLAWVDSGILGGIFWIYILILTIRAIVALVFLHPKLAPLYCFFLMGFVWDILYSPMGSVDRISGDYMILLGYMVLAQHGAATASSRARGKFPSSPTRRVRLVTRLNLARPTPLPTRLAR